MHGVTAMFLCGTLLVGLAYGLQVAFVNFWPGFDPLVDNPILEAMRRSCNSRGCTIKVVGDHLGADIIVSSLFPGPEFCAEACDSPPRVPWPALRAATGAKKILYIGESPGRHPYASLDPTFFDLVLGPTHNPEGAPRRFRFPHWLFDWRWWQSAVRNELHYVTRPMLPLDRRTMNVTLISRTNFGPVPGFRSTLLYYLQTKGVHVSCPSALGKNMPSIEELGWSKLQFLSQSIFNVCPENALFDGFVTEKLFDAVSMANIPVYFGAIGELERKIVNADRAIFVRDTSEAAAIEAAERVASLLRNQTELQRVFALPRFNPGSEGIIREVVWQISQAIAQVVNAAADMKVRIEL